MTRLLPAALFFFSGCASLIFETLCVRRLALVIGSTVQSASLTVSVFLFGLGIGAYLGGRLALRTRRLVLAFAAVEALAGLGALLVLAAIPVLPGLLVPLAHQAPGLLPFAKLGLLSLLLLLPTIAMGASLPLLSHHYVDHLGGDFARSLGLLYAINTLGAAAGVLLTDFWLVPTYGVTRAGWVSFTLYFAVALLAQIDLPVSRQAPTAGDDEGEPSRMTRGSSVGILALTSSGFLGLTFQVLWTRMLAFLNGNDVYAFSITLAVYLLGLVLGSALISMFGRRWYLSGSTIGGLLVMLGFTGYLSLFSIGWVRDLRQAMEGATTGAWLPSIVAGILIMLPSAVCLGLLFPLATDRLRHSSSASGRTVGNAYVLNTVGAALGGLMAGYVFLPQLGLQSSLALAAGLSVLLGAAVLLREPSAKVVGLGSIGLFAVVLWLTPQQAFLKTFYGEDYKGIVFAVDDHYGSIALIRAWDETLQQMSENLHVDGFNMAGNTSTAKRYTTGLAALPILLNDRSKEVLIVCMGLGNTLNTAVSLKQTVHVQCLELSARIPEMLAHTEIGPSVLASPKLSIEIGDGRNHLLYSQKKYDVISAEPPPPTHAGIVNLYSREYYELCASRLNEGGITAQWLPVFQLSVEESKTIIRAFQDVFPYTYLWEAEGLQLCLLGKMEPLDLDFARLEKAVDENKAFLASAGFDSAAKIAAMSLADPEQLRAYTRLTPPLTDDRPRIQYTHHDFTVDAPWLFYEKRPRVLPWKASKAQTALIDHFARGLMAFRVYPYVGNVSLLEKHELARLALETYPNELHYQTRFLATPAHLESLEKDAKSNPNDAQTLFELARVRFINGDLRGAAQAAEAASALPSPDQTLYRLYGLLARYRLGEVKEVRAEFERLAPPSEPNADFLRSLLVPEKR